MNHNQIAQYLQTHGADWITWIKKPPTASHMGKVWEQQIRTARCILNALLKTHGRSLNDEALHTLLIEVEAIVNSRPLTVETTNDVGSYIPLEIKSCFAAAWELHTSRFILTKTLEKSTTHIRNNYV